MKLKCIKRIKPQFLQYTEKKYDVQPDDIVEWEENERGEIIVRFRKRISFRDMMGAGTVKTRTIAVQLEKELYE